MNVRHADTRCGLGERSDGDGAAQLFELGEDVNGSHIEESATTEEHDNARRIDLSQDFFASLRGK